VHARFFRFVQTRFRVRARFSVLGKTTTKFADKHCTEERMVRVVVDTNKAEDDIFNALVFRHPELAVHRERLDVGDVHIVGENAVVVFERKALSDFLASLRDNRYKEQKIRLNAFVAESVAAGKTASWAYVVQSSRVPEWQGAIGPVSTGALNAKHVHCAIVKSALRDGVPSLWANGSNDVADLVAYVARGVTENAFVRQIQAPQCGGDPTTGEQPVTTYASTKVHVNKRRNMDDSSNVHVAMLSCINGMSSSKADALLKHFGTIVAVIEKVRSNDGRKEVENLQVGGKRLGPALTERLASAFE